MKEGISFNEGEKVMMKRKIRSMNGFLQAACCAVILASCAVLPKSAPASLESEQNQAETEIAEAVERTLESNQDIIQPFVTQTYLAQTTLTPQPTSTSDPDSTQVVVPTSTSTQLPTDTPTPTPTFTPVIPTPTAARKDVPASLQTRIQTANILVLEDIAGDKTLKARLDSVLETMGLTGGNVVAVHDATGIFVEQLQSDTEWDLIIVATEQRTPARLDIWEDLTRHVENGAAVIIEAWYLDEISGGSIRPLLEDYCGVQVLRSWTRQEPYEAYEFVVYDVARNNHRLFNYPNTVDVPLIPTFYWNGDVGDLMKLAPVSSAAFIGGLNIYNTLYYGLITECVEGRMVLQTFSTHDYGKEDTINLWQNYIYNTLISRFEYVDSH